MLAVLDTVCRADGPVRLFPSRSGSGEPGLLSARSRGARALLNELLGTLLVEVPRASNQPRRVVPTPAGIRFLVRHHAPVDRARGVREASPLYRERLLRAWKAIASPAELELLRATVSELYGDLLQSRTDDARAFERARAKELVLSWSRAEDAAVRRGLARAMESLGLRAIGAVGDHVTFSGRLHRSAESLFPGDPVEIVLPGWVAPAPSGDSILQKAHVKPLP